MHPNAKLLETFYAAFARRDAAGMVACYDPAATFSDPVFPGLERGRGFAMWRMLCERAEGLIIEASAIDAGETSGTAHWDAHYKFSATGRQVHNRVDAAFAFRDGKILSHVDTFDLWAWAGMALGAKGKLLGWTPLVKNAIRKQAASGLDKYIEKHGAAATAPASPAGG